LHGLFAISGFAANSEVVPGKEGPNGLPGDRIVIDDDYPR